jgi:thioredoxin reductase (NADPH)
MKKKVWDLVIVGAGPSALTAAIYAAREDMTTLVLERGVVGGLTATIDNIENMPGYPDGVAGLDFANSLEKQATKFGAEIMYAEATKISRNPDETFVIETDDEPLTAKTVLLAVGNSYRKIGVPGEEDFAHYCATCDGAFYRGKKITTIGGGNTAVQEAIFLTKFATHVDMIVRSYVKASEILKKDLAKKVAEGKITVHEGFTPTKMARDGLFAKNNAGGEGKLFAADGIFVFAGVIPNTDFLREKTNVKIELDLAGHIISDENLETSEKGIFVSGDVRAGANEQIVSAAGEGATAALRIREFLVEQNREK